MPSENPRDDTPDAQPPRPPQPVPPPPPPVTLGDGRTPDVLSTIRASDSDRNAIAERLRDAFADGRLDDEEFDVRMQRALSARTRQDLEGLLGDLGIPAVTPIPAATSTPAAAQAYPVDPSATGGRQYATSIAVMSGVERKGRWRVPAETTAVAIMGGVDLDLRAATLTSQVTTIRAAAIMGGVDITVPPGVRVEVDGIGLMGGAEEKVDDDNLPSTAPLVRVQWFAMMGGVGVYTKQLKNQKKGKKDREVRDDRHGQLGSG